jgi:hypothetical protein
LFTFWPPGPDDLLYDSSHSRFGIVSAVSLESHWRHVAMSSLVGAVDGAVDL